MSGVSRAPAATASSSAAPPQSTKPWHFHHHLTRLFSPRPPPSRPNAESFNSLDGWRGILCVWMVCFHSFFYMGNFVNDDEMSLVGRSPYLLILNLGFLPVDGFFVLTGFLIAYPLFKEEARRWKAIREAAKEGAEKVAVEGTNSSPWQFDLRTFYYRRVTRMLPSFLIAIYFYCGILFPNGVQHSMDVVRSDRFKEFMERVMPGTVDAPSNCTPVHLFTTLTWMNHLMPFGGCLGWTWSFALQFNFYLFFPLLWKWAHARLAKRGNQTKQLAQSKPSDFILPFLYVFLFLSVLARVWSFIQIRSWDLRHEEALFLGFFWYSNTLTRGGAIVWGVLAAYAMIHTNFVARLASSKSLRMTGWTLSLIVVLAQMLWSRIWADGNMIETPGWSAIIQTQQLGGPSSLSLTTPHIEKYWYHALFHIFVLVGSPLSNLVFAFWLVLVVRGVGGWGRTLQRVLSWPVWFPLSTLSWWVYLVHPALMTRFYSWFVMWGGELGVSVEAVMYHAAFFCAVCFSAAVVAYVFIEMPLELILRRGEAVAAAAGKTASNGAVADSATPVSKPASVAPPTSGRFYRFLRQAIFVYCIFCMVYIVLHHAAMYSAVVGLEPKEYITNASA